MKQADYAESSAWMHMLLETIPQPARWCRDFLHTMRRDGPPEPLSAVVARSMEKPDDVLVEHLTQLAKAQSTPYRARPAAYRFRRMRGANAISCRRSL